MDKLSSVLHDCCVFEHLFYLLCEQCYENGGIAECPVGWSRICQAVLCCAETVPGISASVLVHSLFF